MLNRKVAEEIIKKAMSPYARLQYFLLLVFQECISITMADNQAGRKNWKAEIFLSYNQLQGRTAWGS